MGHQSADRVRAWLGCARWRFAAACRRIAAPFPVGERTACAGNSRKRSSVRRIEHAPAAPAGRPHAGGSQAALCAGESNLRCVERGRPVRREVLVRRACAATSRSGRCACGTDSAAAAIRVRRQLQRRRPADGLFPHARRSRLRRKGRRHARRHLQRRRRAERRARLHLQAARYQTDTRNGRRHVRQGIRRLVYIALGALAAACATDRVHQEGLAAVEGGHYEEGLAMLEQATHDDPANMTYRVDLKTQRDAVVTRLLAAADIARRTGKLDDAEKLYERVLAIVSGSTRAQRGLDAVADDRRHGELIEQGGKDLQAGAVDQADAKLRAVLSEDPGFAAALALREKVEQARGPVNVVPKVHARDNRPVTLQFRDANTKMVFEVLSRQSGINFVFDKDVKSDGKTTIYVQQVPVEQAIELVLGQNQLSRQVLSENMVLIYPNTAQKQKDYQDQIVKAVYLTNADPKQAQSLLKTMLNVKTTFIDDRASVIVIRDTPEVVHMAEKLLASLDLPEAEVMMEVEVLEITRSKLQQLGIAYPTAATVSTPNDPTVYDLFHNIDSHNLSVTPLSATVDLLKQVGLSNILASPRIRARNHEKAKILIGSRVPVITNSTVLVGGGTSAASSVQYLDVGLTLEVEPTIYLDGDVAIKVNLEVSNIIKEVQVGGSDGSGSLAYQIGTRNANTTLRLKDGETQILAGLINDQDTHSSNHVPGLGDIPVLGRLFGTYRDSADKSEIVLSITPRIIRSQPRPAAETTEFWYGTESSVRSAPMGSVSVAGGNGSGAPANTGSNGGAVDLSAAGAAN